MRQTSFTVLPSKGGRIRYSVQRSLGCSDSALFRCYLDSLRIGNYIAIENAYFSDDGQLVRPGGQFQFGTRG